jgi:hypothetical protein
MRTPEEEECEAKLAALRAAIAEGDASGIAEGDPFEYVRRRLNLPARSHPKSHTHETPPI